MHHIEEADDRAPWSGKNMPVEVKVVSMRNEPNSLKLPMILVVLISLIVSCSQHQASNRKVNTAVPNILTENPELRPRLEKIVEIMEKERVKNHIPGMALAVVHGDEIVLAKGFGLADVDRKVPVDPGTLFAIGSSTKAFTSALVGMMVEEGKMAWDDPVEKYVPYLKFKVDSENDKDAVTLRDMLSHRSGFTRMGILWVSGENDQETILRAAVNAEPWDTYGEGFNYNNIMYLGAGFAAGEVANSNWDQLVRARLLNPLGMTSSYPSYHDVQKLPELSKGYSWDTEKETLDQLPMRNLDAIGPAGSINSNVLDMAQWLRFQLNKGAIAGKRLIAEEHLLETRKAVVPLGSGASYGLGWFVQEFKGKPIVFHGGNIDGYAAMVAFAPENDFGYVLLTNTSVSGLQNGSIGHVFGQLINDPKETATAASNPAEATNYEPYLGEYYADFGSFKEEYLAVLVQNGKLAVDVPRQTIYELKPENEEGKWAFAITDTIAVSFEKNEAGAVQLMRLHQNGFDFELPKKGVEIKPEIDEAALAKYVGSYYSEENKRNVNFVIKNHRLGIVANERLTMELHLPDADGHRFLRARSRVSVVFNESENGEVLSVSRYRDGELREVMKRVASEDLPTVEAIQALRQLDDRKAALAKLGVLKWQGKVHFTHSGISGDLTFHADGHKRYLLGMDMGSFGRSLTGSTPSYAATYASHSPFDEHAGKYLEQLRKGHLGINYLDWNDLYEKVDVLGQEKLGDAATYRVRLSGGSTPPTFLWVDAATGDVLRQKLTLLHPLAGSFDVEVNYGDFRDIEGLRIPHEVKTKNQHVGELVYQFQSIQTHQDVNPEFFIVRDEVR